jgi:hypothetical protein
MVLRVIAKHQGCPPAAYGVLINHFQVNISLAQGDESIGGSRMKIIMPDVKNVSEELFKNCMNIDRLFDYSKVF